MKEAVTVVNPATGLTAGALARFDTGDDIALIDPSVLSSLGPVQPVGTDTVQGIGGAPISGSVYLLDLSLGPEGYIAGVRFVAVPIAGSLGIGVLAGDNVLNSGVLLRDGPGRFWSFTATGSTPGPASSVWPTVGFLGALAGLAALAVGLRIT